MSITEKIWNKYLGINTPAASLAKEAAVEIERLEKQSEEHREQLRIQERHITLLTKQNDLLHDALYKIKMNSKLGGSPSKHAKENEDLAANAIKNAKLAADETVSSALMAALQAQQAEKARRLAALPPGTCQECEGEGEFGGQFCGGFHTCESCHGTGKSK